MQACRKREMAVFEAYFIDFKFFKAGSGAVVKMVQENQKQHGKRDIEVVGDESVN